MEIYNTVGSNKSYIKYSEYSIFIIYINQKRKEKKCMLQDGDNVI